MNKIRKNPHSGKYTRKGPGVKPQHGAPLRGYKLLKAARRYTK